MPLFNGQFKTPRKIDGKCRAAPDPAFHRDAAAQIIKQAPADRQTETRAIVLLDIQRPGMDGYDVARALRRIEALQNVPIVAVTSYAMRGDRTKALAAGCDGYIEKPIDPDSFVSDVARFLPAAFRAQP